MREEHVRLFRCIRCGDIELVLNAKEREESEIITGTIFCKCGAGYSIVKGIPRFIERWQSLTDTQSKFEFQWETWGKEDVIFGRTKQQSREYLLKTAGFQLREDFFKNKIVLDAGCGHGRFVELFAEMGATLSVGIDLGDGIEKAQWRNKSLQNTLFVQGNLLNIPFRPEVFDYIWCNGVIHHTPNAKLGAKNLCQCTKRGGYVNLWLYPKGGFAWEFSQKLIRLFTTRLPPRLLMWLCYSVVPLLYIVPTYSGTNPRKNSWRHCAQVIYDWYSPKYQSHHSNEEAIQWLKEFGCIETETKEPATTVIGKK